MRLLQFALACWMSAWCALAGAQTKPYVDLKPPQPTAGGSKVEVIEFFSWSCPHCNAFDPSLQAWVKKQGGAIEFKRVPAALRPEWVPLQRAWLALDEMGEAGKLHEKVFRAVHVDKLPFKTDEQVAVLLQKLGVEPQKLAAAMAASQARLKNINAMIGNYRVDHVPWIVIDGRYAVSPAIAGEAAGEYDEVKAGELALKAMDGLVAKSRK